MALDHFISPVVPDAAAKTVRFGAGNTTNDQVTQAEVGKFCKLVGESRYNLCAVDDPIEGVVYAVELAPQNGYSIASVLSASETRIRVTFEGTVAIGDYVVAGTPVAKGTALTTYPKVKKAASQAAAPYMWRVVSLGTAGTGVDGTVGVIERV